jgi:hypothetical protein
VFLRVIKYLFVFLILWTTARTQDLAPFKSSNNNNNLDSKVLSSYPSEYFINNNNGNRNLSININDAGYFNYLINNKLSDRDRILIPQNHTYNTTAVKKNDERLTTKLMASYRENIKFGGFWNSYAIINFSPSVNIQPFDFVSINANQNLSCFVNIHDIKQNFRTLFIHGAVVLAIDNSFKFIFGSNKMIPSIISFTAKNIIISFLNNSITSKNRNQIFGYNGYYYSISIRF